MLNSLLIYFNAGGLKQTYDNTKIYFNAGGLKQNTRHVRGLDRSRQTDSEDFTFIQCRFILFSSSSLFFFSFSFLFIFFYFSIIIPWVYNYIEACRAAALHARGRGGSLLYNSTVPGTV